MTRNNSIDTARGLAICLMVIGHCYSKNNAILTVIYAFHMPFFFLVSGVLYGEKWKNGVHLNTIRICLKFLVPYFVFEVLFKLFCLVLQRPENFIQSFSGAFFKTILPLLGITVTWFLPCQLVVVLLSAVVVKATKNKVLIGAGSFTVFLTVGLFARIDCNYVTVALRAFIGMGFFAVGYYGKVLFTKKGKWYVLLPVSAAFIASALLNGMVSLVSLTLSNPIFYVINGILGSYVLLQLSIRFRENSLSKKFSYIGKNAVIILSLHMIAVEALRLLDYKLFDNALNHLGLLEGFLFGGMVIGVMCSVIPLCNRYFWYLFGIHRRI